MSLYGLALDGGDLLGAVADGYGRVTLNPSPVPWLSPNPRLVERLLNTGDRAVHQGTWQEPTHWYAPNRLRMVKVELQTAPVTLVYPEVAWEDFARQQAVNNLEYSLLLEVNQELDPTQQFRMSDYETQRQSPVEVPQYVVA